MVVYTTRPDTIFGASYMVISPEHNVLKSWTHKLKNLEEVQEYQHQAARKSEFERTELTQDKEKTGVQLHGINAVNPATGEEIPIYIADYVLASYGTGAIMAVPGHDERDWAFARRYDLPIIEVVSGGNIEEEAYVDSDDGTLVNSGFLNGKTVPKAQALMVEWLEEKDLGYARTNYRLRDWVFSRQRYWGEPIPMVWCDACDEWVPLDEADLPLELPHIEDFQPTETGESPLARHDEWVNTTCPKCGGAARRETDTMPQWAGSSWYFLRYCDPHNDTELADPEQLAYWMPVDWYNGGMEHTTLHMLYSRFWHKFLFDIDVVEDAEPYAKRTSHGMILGENGEKMSKSRGNVVNPDDVVDEYGADTLRVYEMFIGDFEKNAPWNTSSIIGSRRFLDRVWAASWQLVDGTGYRKELEPTIHRTIKKVTEDIELLKHNTAIASLMSLLNEFNAAGGANNDEFKTFLHLLNPFAPHITEEIWQRLGYGDEIAKTPWPQYDEAKTIDETVEIAIQVNGRVRGHLMIPQAIEEADALAQAKEVEGVKNYLDGKTIMKEIWVPGKLINFAVKG